MEIAVVGATAVVTVDDGGVTDARIAITALAPTIRRVPEAEAALIGSDGGDAAVAAAAAAAAAAAEPISDVRGSADYRRAMAAVIARRAIEAARVHGDADPGGAHGVKDREPTLTRERRSPTRSSSTPARTCSRPCATWSA